MPFKMNRLVHKESYPQSASSTTRTQGVFHGLKMELVSFADELLSSSSHDKQLIGARILHKFVTCNPYVDETLRKIGTSMSVIERLINMLNWKNPAEKKSAGQQQ